MRRSSLGRFVSLVLGALAIAGAGAVAAQPRPSAHDLQLEVIVNGTPAGLIGAFHRRADGRLAAAPDELRQLGLEPDPAAAATDGLLDLDRLPGATYRLDAAAQAILFTVDDSRRAARIYDLSGMSVGSEPAPDTASARSGYGAVLNYLLFATSDAQLPRFWSLGGNRPAFAASLDGRVFSPYGVLSQTAIIGSRAEQELDPLRLDTTWTHSDPRSAVTGRAGDVISGSLAWTRSIRLGGVQVQRNFALRPDLVTLPMPNVSGSPAVPSTVDVYVNNIRSFSRDLPAGPFEVRNLPVMSGPGTQRIVVRDSFGREVVTDQAFYSSARLLRAGLYDFSLEAGFPRLYYGVRSNDYDRHPVASASLRRGITDWLTVEGHAEGGGQLWNGGAGLAVPAGSFGVASLAAAASTASGDPGAQLAASLEAGIGSTIFYARTQRTFGNYTDIAAVAAETVSTSLLSSSPLPRPFSFRPPRALDQIALSFPLRFDIARLTLSFTQLRDDADGRYRIFGASYSRPLARDVSLFATAYKDFEAGRGYGIFAGVTRSFGDGVSATASASAASTGSAVGVDAVKAQPIEIGSHGWRLRDREGDVPQRAAAGSYRASFARLQAGVEQFGNSVRAAGEAEGALVLAGGDLFFANRIDDAFAVVDAGAPGVDVFYENRPVGTTNRKGQLLVPYLNAYQANRLSIDPKSLPVDADIARTKATVVPADRSGAVVNFGIDTRSQAALVSFRNRRGAVLAAGSRGHVEGSGESFVIGYDGQAYLRGLARENSVVIELADGSACRADLRFVPQPGTQVRIEGVPCD